MPYPIFESGGRWWMNGDFSNGASMSSGWYDQDGAGPLGDVYVSGLIGDANHNDTLTGGVTEDYLQGRGGADSLYGGLGTDTLDAGIDDHAADYLAGGDQNDSYWSVEAGDIIFESSGPDGGYDSVTVASGSFVLPANVEELTLVFGSNAFGGTGNNLANYIGGNEFANLLGGAGGNDSIRGDGGADTIYGDAGSDRIDGNDGADALYGGGGNDSIDGGTGADTLNGGAGNDTLMGGDTGNTLIGGAGNDLFWVASGDVVKESLDGGQDEARFNQAGTYTLAANVETGTVIGGGAYLNGNVLGNLLNGDTLANRLDGRGGNDTLNGYEGKDTLLGGAGDDTLMGGAGADRLSGGDGVDTVSYGGPGGPGGVFASLLTGTASDTFGNTDTLISIENLQGSSNDDLFKGDANSNNLSGFDGDDTLVGGGGNDALDGNLGADVFSYNEAGTGNADSIYGFQHGEEHFELDNSFFASLGGTGALTTTMFRVLGSGAVDGDDFIQYDTGTGKLYYDPDGSGGTARKLIATIMGSPDNLDASDFQVI